MNKFTRIIILGSDGCYSKCEIGDDLLNSFKTVEEKARFIGEELMPHLEAIEIERESVKSGNPKSCVILGISTVDFLN